MLDDLGLVGGGRVGGLLSGDGGLQCGDEGGVGGGGALGALGAGSCWHYLHGVDSYRGGVEGAGAAGVAGLLGAEDVLAGGVAEGGAVAHGGWA